MTNNSDEKLLQQVLKNDVAYKSYRITVIVFSVVVFLFIASVFGFKFYLDKVIKTMENNYLENTKKIINTKNDIILANQWERLPINERKERLRTQYYKIIRYYTLNSTENTKMDDKQILSSFNTLWNCYLRLNNVNFFLPLAYMKVATNFNPVYKKNYKYGIAAFYKKMGERISNLELVKNDPTFQTVYKGVITLYNPSNSIKLLMARIDDLMITFNNREDWVLLALFTNEYDVISKYWDNGKGKIPDSLYQRGTLKEALKYYYAFTNFQIPEEKID